VVNPASYRVAMVQILVEGGKPHANLGRAASAIRDAAAKGCRLVVLPECLNLGWTDPSARDLAEPIPGPHAEVLVRAAKEHRVFVAAGLVERVGDRLFNAAVLIDPSGQILLHHRKINELDIALDLYTVGDRLGVVETELGTLGLASVGTLFGAVTAQMRARELLFPVLLLPAVVPVLLSSVSATQIVLAGEPLAAAAAWLKLLAAADLVYLVVGVLTFEFVLEG
jgi:hypothetical protein